MHCQANQQRQNYTCSASIHGFSVAMYMIRARLLHAPNKNVWIFIYLFMINNTSIYQLYS